MGGTLPGGSHTDPGRRCQRFSHTPLAERPNAALYDVAPEVVVNADENARWAAWIARGRVHERLVRRRFRGPVCSRLEPPSPTRSSDHDDGLRRSCQLSARIFRFKSSDNAAIASSRLPSHWSLLTGGSLSPSTKWLGGACRQRYHTQGLRRSNDVRVIWHFLRELRLGGPMRGMAGEHDRWVRGAMVACTRSHTVGACAQ
jgi:hypothetical protein